MSATASAQYLVSLLSCSALLAGAAAGVHHPARNNAAPAHSIRVDSSLVLIPISVTDPMNRPVTGLGRDTFRVFEDKVEQQISQFSSEDVPLSVGIVFDSSGSMGPKLHTSRQAVAQFLKEVNPQDEFFLIEFNDRPNLVTGFTNDPNDVQSGLAFTISQGRTSLRDAIYLAIHTMRQARNPRKAILIISDGGDNNSRYTDGEIKNAVLEADIQVYAMGIFEPFAGGLTSGLTSDEAAGPRLLNDLSEVTGGHHFAVERLADLPEIAASIGRELRNQYVVGYVPKNAERDGKYRRVKVTLVQPHGTPRWRAAFRVGYHAPGY